LEDFLNPFHPAPPLWGVDTEREMTMALFQRNLPGWERLLRALTGLAVIGYVLFAGWIGWWLAGAVAVGASMVGTALVGSCPAACPLERR
jgi:hypothetical protein